jgi:hypothetical protein
MRASTAMPALPKRGAATARDHALFRTYPLSGEVRLSTGLAPTPYHVYDGHGVFIGGSADFAAARELLAPEQVAPVRTDDGRALMGVWVFDFTDASLGPHHELQLSLFVSRQPVAPLPSRRMSVIEAMLTRPNVQMLCHGIWNSTPTAVAYNRELLALDARESNSTIERDAAAMRFHVSDRVSQAPLIEGCVQRPQRASLRANFALIRRLGLRRAAAMAKQRWIRVPVLNPVGHGLSRNAAADSFTHSAATALRYFDARRDRLVVHEPRYRQLQFEPRFVQSIVGFRFVYLFPS